MKELLPPTGELVLPDGRRLVVPCATGAVSNGFHSFDELYEQRHALFIALLKTLRAEKIIELGAPWRTKTHSDGASYEGWFVLGIGVTPGRQITYHLPDRLWDDCSFAVTLEQTPEYDGHTSHDVIERLLAL
jgi:hypothetical protein